MRSLTASELLNLWEQGQSQSPVHRGLMLLSAACDESPPDDLAMLSIGQRNAKLLQLHQRIFGSKLFSVAKCPSCSEALDLSLNVADLQCASPAGSSEDHSIRHEGFEVRFRLPNSLDLAAIAESTELQTAVRHLLTRCMLSAHQEGKDCPIEQLSPATVKAVADAMARTDPMGDIQIALSCPACGHAFQVAFDVVSFFWSEINAWSQFMLYQVHCLASAYGWSEAEILEMSSWRRQYYLNLINQ